MLPGRSRRIMHWHPETTTTVGMAMDRIHPSSTGYAVWAEGLRRTDWPGLRYGQIADAVRSESQSSLAHRQFMRLGANIKIEV